LLIAILLVCCNVSLNAQNDRRIELTDPIVNQKFAPDHIFVVVEQNPQFPGGDSTLMEFIKKRLIIPTDSGCIQNRPGKVICSLLIEKGGSISKITVLKSLDPCRDKEAIRVLKLLPNFIPGKHNGELVRVYYNIPIYFKD